MSEPVSRRTALKTIALTGMAALPGTEAQAGLLRRGPDGSVSGKMTGAQALAVTAAVRELAARLT